MEIVIPQCPAIWGGYFSFLGVTMEAAKAHSNTVTVMEPFPCPLVSEFRKYYRHSSPNPVWFQMWTFEQWLYLAQWMTDTKRTIVVKMDSDCMVFADLQRVWDQTKNPRLTLPVPDTFITVGAANLIAEYIVKSFCDGREREICNPQHVCDFAILHPFFHSFGASDLRDDHGHGLIDNNLFLTDGNPSFETHKDI